MQRTLFDEIVDRAEGRTGAAGRKVAAPPKRQRQGVIRAVCHNPVKVYLCPECGAACTHLVCEALGLTTFADKCPGCFQWVNFSEQVIESKKVA